MKILITGGSGFVGSNLAIFLKKKLKFSKVYSLDNLSRNGSIINNKRLKQNKIINYKINIEDFNKVNSLPRFDLIIDCCAEPAIEVSKKNPDLVFNTNLIGTFNILKKCIRNKSNLIFLSSSRVYSIKKLRKIINKPIITKKIIIKKKVNENFETSSASSLYGFTKLASEKLIKEFFYGTKLKYLINRFGVIAGPWQFGKQDQGFVPLWVAKHFYKKKLSYIGFGGHGHQVRDILHIDDVCNIILIQVKNLNKINNETFNIGGGENNAISLKTLSDKCQKITSNIIRINRVNKTSQFDIPYYVSDNNKVKRKYKWKPKKNLDTILQDIYNWLSKNKNIKKYFR